jgi:hypothetical protein
MTYDVVRLIIRSIPACGNDPAPTPLTPVNMGAAFPVIFAFFPVSQSAGRHETRARALDAARNGLGHMTQRCPLCDCNCADPPRGVREPHGTDFRSGTWPHHRVTASAADTGRVSSVMPVMGLLPRRTRAGGERPEPVGNLTVPTRITNQGRRP